MPSKPKQFSQDIILNKNKLLDVKYDSTLSNLTEEGQFGYSTILKLPVWYDGVSVKSVLDVTPNQLSLPTANLDLNNNRLINLSNPVNSQDAVSKYYQDKQQELLIYNNVLKISNYDNISYDTFDITGSGIFSQSGLIYDSINTRYSVINTSFLITPNLITVVGTHINFRFHLESTTTYTLGYSLTTSAGPFTTFSPDTNVNIPSGFTQLYVKIIFTGVGLVSSYGCLYDISSLDNLDNLIDVVITTPIIDNVIKYNGSNWVNSPPVLYVGTNISTFTLTGSAVPSGVGSLILSPDFFYIGKIIKINTVWNNTGTPVIDFNLGSTNLISAQPLSGDASIEVTIVCATSGVSGILQTSIKELRPSSNTQIAYQTSTIINLTLSHTLDMFFNSNGVLNVYEFFVSQL